MGDDTVGFIGGLVIGVLLGIFSVLLTYSIMDVMRDNAVHVLAHVPKEQAMEAKAIVLAEEKHKKEHDIKFPVE